MFEDPVEDIIKILYGPIHAKIYTIVKTKKKITEPELRSNFSENEIEEYKTSLTELQREVFIKIIDRDIPPEPNAPKRQKGMNKITEILFNDKYDYERLHNKYNFLKQNMLQFFKDEDEKKYYCSKCGIYKSENLASREDFTCSKCKIKYQKRDVDYTDMKNKCKNIWDILDKKFELKLENLNQEFYSKNYDYIKAKYGNEMLINFRTDKKEIIFDDDNEPYISNILKNLEKSDKEQDKLVFFELIEAFNKTKKK